MSEQPTTPSKYKGLGAAMGAELIISFQFRIGVILATPLYNRPGQMRPGDILHWPGEKNPLEFASPVILNSTSTEKNVCSHRS